MIDCHFCSKDIRTFCKPEGEDAPNGLVKIRDKTRVVTESLGSCAIVTVRVVAIDSDSSRNRPTISNLLLSCDLQGRKIVCYDLRHALGCITELFNIILVICSS